MKESELIACDFEAWGRDASPPGLVVLGVVRYLGVYIAHVRKDGEMYWIVGDPDVSYTATFGTRREARAHAVELYYDADRVEARAYEAGDRYEEREARRKR